VTTKYTLVIDKDKAKLKLLITANDGGHAQAQAADIYVRRHIYRNCLEDWHIMTFLINNVICGLGLSVTKIL
jgi:hypothetical protein